MIEITKEMATEYLDRTVTMLRQILEPIAPDRKTWADGQVYVLLGTTDGDRILVNGAKRLAEALNHPYRISSSSERFDKISFRWKGIEIYDYDNDKRIKHIA